MTSCSCGVERKTFWLWRDNDGVLHASGFRPSQGTVRAVLAATARDALLPMQDGAVPKHTVTDVDDSTIFWDGRCSKVAAGS